MSLDHGEIDVRWMRRHLQMTQEEFARVMSVAKLSVQRWESGGLPAGLHRDVLSSISSAIHAATMGRDGGARLAQIRSRLEGGVSALVYKRLVEEVGA